MSLFSEGFFSNQEDAIQQQSPLNAILSECKDFSTFFKQIQQNDLMANKEIERFFKNISSKIQLLLERFNNNDDKIIANSLATSRNCSTLNMVNSVKPQIVDEAFQEAKNSQLAKNNALQASISRYPSPTQQKTPKTNEQCKLFRDEEKPTQKSHVDKIIKQNNDNKLIKVDFNKS